MRLRCLCGIIYNSIGNNPLWSNVPLIYCVIILQLQQASGCSTAVHSQRPARVSNVMDLWFFDPNFVWKTVGSSLFFSPLWNAEGREKKGEKEKKKGRKRERKQEEQMGEANWLGSSAGETWCFMSGGAAPATTSRNDLETRRKKIPSRKQWTQKKVEREKTDGRTDTGQVFTSNWLWKIPATFLTDIQEKLRCWRARIGSKVSDHLLSSKTKWWKSHWHHKRDGKVLSKSGTNELGGKKKQSSRPTLTQRVTVNVRRRRVCALYTPVIAEFGTLYTVVLYLTYNIH